jgi:hypothetical protein
MKCPICGKEIHATKNLRCQNCEFDDIRIEFVNDEERIFWETYVVKPCKYSYEQNNKLRAEIAELKAEFKLLAEGSKIPNKSRDSKSKNIESTPQLAMQEGWNYDDPIAHPNYSEGNCNGTKFEISNISASMTGAKKAVVTFLVKKVIARSMGSPADSFLVRYRVKDQDGVIVLNETQSVSGLMPGDVSREKIELNGIDPGKYSIDIVSYN